MKTLQLLDASTVLPALTALREELTALRRELTPPDDPAETTPPEWLPVRKIAARYGLGLRTAARYIASAQSAGALRYFHPTDINGAPGHPLYHLSDFHRYITRNGIHTEKKTPPAAHPVPHPAEQHPNNSQPACRQVNRQS